MDQRERIGDFEEGIRAAIQGYLANLWTALPGIVVDTTNLVTKMTITVQPTIKCVQRTQGKQNAVVDTWIKLPVLLDVPVIFPRVGSFALTLPIAAGDEVLVVFASRCIDSWWQNGGIQNQAELRLHDLSDGFAIPGPCSLPNVLPNISTTTAQLRSQDGTCYIEIAPGGVINIVAPGGLNVNGDTVVTGTIDATEEITAKGSHTVSEHVHGGVEGGGSDTDTPTG